ncbi:uncharacterized protein BYT42DRAFT_268995 [Radiomyces spectabilis]|uniref:uncharacterized protein n=1 Tax=Radiomyces spectabilis TaxID=64574 RepID=UPI00221EF57A|nr:uncharacterized protein BYT42DRAFT_268995 [Radiomyces spectabilis]KAI8384645.1 hypothetical protein BYT42DRAFT_268995 [Radiomyces spectabilis]
MMQHYRTHMSPKSRKTQKRVCEEAQHPRPRLHAHHRIQSDSYDVERPLTIDQHLNNYHRSLSSRLVKLDTLSPPKQHVSAPIRVLPTPSSVGLPIGFSPLSSRSSSSSISVEEPQSPSPDRLACPSVSSTSTETFFQHRPLTFSKKPDTICTTLLGPTNSAEPASDFPAPALQHEMTTKTSYMPAQLQEQYKEAQQHGTERSRTQDNEGSEIEPSSDGLLQLAHVVSTFG